MINNISILLALLVLLVTSCGNPDAEKSQPPVLTKQQAGEQLTTTAIHNQADENPAFAKTVATEEAGLKPMAGAGKERPAKDGQIVYDEKRPLKWSDFKSKARYGVSHSAFTEAGIFYEPIDYNNEFVELAVVSYFDVNRSWVKPDKKDDYLLAHEQRHFDICEAYRRKLMKQLDDAQPIDRSKFNDVVKKYFNLNFNSMTSIQRQYDQQTAHSLVKQKQAEWDKKVYDELNRFSGYKEMKIKLKLK